MENHANRKETPFEFGDRSTSDVVVRLRTPGGRDEWLYCHTSILIEKSKYFADRLSDTWPTCQILDARTCVEVHCQDSDFDFNISLLRLLYIVSDCLISESGHGVKNALGILRVATELDCPIIVSSCVEFLESVPWEETEEEEILQTIPTMGPTVNPILSRLQPVEPTTIYRIFLSTLRLATSSPPPSLRDLKTSAQEQLEYMLTDDDDAPLIASCDEVKFEVRECTKSLFLSFNALLESWSTEDNTTVSNTVRLDSLQIYLSDLSWVCQISCKLEIMRDMVLFWLEVSETLVNKIEDNNRKVETIEIKSKVIEIATKVIEAIGYGNVILPTAKRLHMVKVWLPFARITKPLIDAGSTELELDDDSGKLRVESDVWQTLESAFISIILALPSEYQADILTEWLGNKHIQYPDLTEAFEVWCYRSKVAHKRLASCNAPPLL